MSRNTFQMGSNEKSIEGLIPWMGLSAETVRRGPPGIGFLSNPAQGDLMKLLFIYSLIRSGRLWCASGILFIST